MWWCDEEEKLQQQAEAAWEALAEPAEDLFEPLDGDPGFGEDGEDIDEDGPPPAFAWHIPEGAPEPGPVPEPPLVNGHHNGPPVLNGFHAEEDVLEDGPAEAMHGHPLNNFPE